MARTAVVQVLIAVPTRAWARRLGSMLLDARLCACVQTLGPIESRYVWQGKVETAREYLLVVKARAAAARAIEAAVRAMHPYQVPEILAVPVAAGSAPYLDWVAQVTRPPRRRPRPRPRARRRPPS